MKLSSAKQVISDASLFRRSRLLSIATGCWHQNDKRGCMMHRELIQMQRLQEVAIHFEYSTREASGTTKETTHGHVRGYFGPIFGTVTSFHYFVLTTLACIPLPRPGIRAVDYMYYHQSCGTDIEAV